MIARHRLVDTDPLIRWAVERESIRQKKAAGQPPPWTDDPILQKYRFCNVRRIDDRVSQWLVHNVLNKHDDFSNQLTFLKWVALCRWVNWPPSLIGIYNEGLVTSQSIDLQTVGDWLDGTVILGNKAWTGAYMVRAPSRKKYGIMSKGEFVAVVVVGGLDTVKDDLQCALTHPCSAKGVWTVLCSVPNWGSFMAGQVVADLTYTPLLSGAYDLNSWAPQGPGSRRGFNRLMGRPLKTKISDEEWSERLQEWRELVAKAIGSELNLMDLQNCCCETDKYLRVKSGEGRPRSTYKPETAY